MLRVLTIIFLLGLSFESFAGDLQVRNGKFAYPLTEKFNENGFRSWKIIGGGIDQEYQSRFDKSLHVREASTGLRSASTVPVTIEQKVSRSTVLKNRQDRRLLLRIYRQHGLWRGGFLGR